MQWSTTGRTVSKVHSLALPGVQASPRTWLVMRSTSGAVARDGLRVLVELGRALAQPVLRVRVLGDVDEPLRDAHVAQQPDGAASAASAACTSVMPWVSTPIARAMSAKRL